MNSKTTLALFLCLFTAICSEAAWRPAKTTTSFPIWTPDSDRAHPQPKKRKQQNQPQSLSWQVTAGFELGAAAGAYGATKTNNNFVSIGSFALAAGGAFYCKRQMMPGKDYPEYESYCEAFAIRDDIQQSKVATAKVLEKWHNSPLYQAAYTTWEPRKMALVGFSSLFVITKIIKWLRPSKTK